MALLVIQTPAPETPAQTRHLFHLQSGSATSCTVRLAVLFVAPEKEMTPGWVAFTRGPNCFHLLLSHRNVCPRRTRRESAFSIRPNVLFARCTIAGAIDFAGYVRIADR